MSERLYVGLDVGGTKCAALIGTADGAVLDRREWPSHAQRGPALMIDDLCRSAGELMQQYPGALAIGVSIGGPMDSGRGIIHSPPNLPGWEAIPLASILTERLGLPTRIEHDAAACALAEHRWGAGKNASRLIYLTCGTGFGAGIIIDGKIYRGSDGRSVEVGHVRYRDDGPTAFGKVGCAEAFCAGTALGGLAAWKFPNRWPAVPSPKEIADLAQRGDADATAVIEINATAVGDICAMLGDLLRPDVLLLGSLARYLGDHWVDRVRLRFVEQSLPDTATGCRIAPAGLGDRLQDCSALVVAVTAA